MNPTPKTSQEERVAKIEGILEQIDKRLNHIEARLNHVEAEISSLRTEISTQMSSLRTDTSTEISSLRTEIISLRNNIDRRFESLFKWTVGLILGMWITIIMTLIPILLKILGII